MVSACAIFRARQVTRSGSAGRAPGGAVHLPPPAIKMVLVGTSGQRWKSRHRQSKTSSKGVLPLMLKSLSPAYALDLHHTTGKPWPSLRKSESLVTDIVRFHRSCLASPRCSFSQFARRSAPWSRPPTTRSTWSSVMAVDHEHLPLQARKDLKEVGWTKGLELAEVARAEGQHFDCATWMHKARAMRKEEFKREVEKETDKAGDGTARDHLLQALQKPDPRYRAGAGDRGLMLGTDKSRGHCLEMICADFLAGAHLEDGNAAILLQSITRFFKFLPGQERRAFLEQVTEKAS
jgi:hypothetical protein